MTHPLRFTAIFLLLFLASGCSSPTSDPLGILAAKFDRYPEYSVVLQDMERRGSFFASYHHRYKVIYGDPLTADEAGAVKAEAATFEAAPNDLPPAEAPTGDALGFKTLDTPWYEVTERFFRQHQDNLGMVLLAKKNDGQKEEAVFPPGYQYVGNSHYGHWRRDSRGNSFWEFYGKYALFRDILGLGSRTLYRNDYDSYRSYRSRRRPYFGPSNSYGTRGSVTKTSHPSFFQRQQARESARRSSFSDRVKSRTGRSSMNRTRSRSSSFGK